MKTTCRALVALVIVFSTLLPARAEDGPREVVNAYMQALKSRDYGAAAKCLGFDLPPQTWSMVKPILEQQPYFVWAVKDYKIVEVQQDGGLATVTVEETQFKDLLPEARAFIAKEVPALANAIVWGDNIVRERFVLVHLDGKWQFDNGHSGVQYQALMKSLSTEMTKMATGGGMKGLQDLMIREGAKFINSIGFGQLVQTFASTAPLAPVLAGIAVPNFIRARSQGQTTACKSNLKNIGTALEMYSTDNSGHYPTQLSKLTPDYLKTIPTCPSAGHDTYSASYESHLLPDGYTVMCQGANHEKAGLGPNFPQYTSERGLLDGIQR